MHKRSIEKAHVYTAEANLHKNPYRTQGFLKIMNKPEINQLLAKVSPLAKTIPELISLRKFSACAEGGGDQLLLPARLSLA